VKQLALSYIIPTLNEEYFLPKVLKSINDYTPADLTYEIVVADNGSDDKTISIAQDRGVDVIIDECAAVGGLRNLAVKRSCGRVLVFLDADISLTTLWGENISNVYQSIIDKPNQITGSRCGVPEKASWIEEIWFKPLFDKSGKYINSGHMITSRELFESIGGFDEKLETGEDYVFCQSALKMKATIVNNSLLVVVHDGYPKTLYQFILREMWHGRGDCGSLGTILRSKVATLSILFMILHLTFITGMVMYSVEVTVASLVFIVGSCVAASIGKHNTKTVKSLILVSLLYYFYFLSRFLSCVSFIRIRSIRRKCD